MKNRVTEKFYTKDEVAKKCITSLDGIIKLGVYLEPSCGEGAFSNNLQDCIVITNDIDTLCKADTNIDFLNYRYTRDDDFILIGNPPFGRQSALAKAFIKHGAKMPKCAGIAFILPRSFKKPSMYSVFPPCFHLELELDLEPNSFIHEDIEYNVPAVFQVWLRKKHMREIYHKIEPINFKYVKKDNIYINLIIRRVGSKAGQAYLPDTSYNYNSNSHYFIQVTKDVDITALLAKINIQKYPDNTVGPRSISKPELNAVLNSIIL